MPGSLYRLPFTNPTSPRATVYGYIAYGCIVDFLLLAYPGADVLLKTLSGFSDIASIYSAGTLQCIDRHGN